MLSVMIFAAGCASTKVVNQQSQIGDEKIARPGNVLVYSFGATAADIPAESAAAGEIETNNPTQTPEQVEMAAKLGDEIAHELVAKIQAMGMPAEVASGASTAATGDLEIKGYFVTIDKGSGAKRLLIGFGSGGADLNTVVEAYLVTENGLRQLGSGEVDAGDSKGPGLLVPLAVTVATKNPIGLAVGGAVKLGEAATGSDTIKGSAKRTADEIAEKLQAAFEKQGWI
jgi:hypothetical protein